MRDKSDKGIAVEEPVDTALEENSFHWRKISNKQTFSLEGFVYSITSHLSKVKQPSLSSNVDVINLEFSLSVYK